MLQSFPRICCFFSLLLAPDSTLTYDAQMPVIKRPLQCTHIHTQHPMQYFSFKSVSAKVIYYDAIGRCYIESPTATEGWAGQRGRRRWETIVGGTAAEKRNQ